MNEKLSATELQAMNKNFISVSSLFTDRDLDISKRYDNEESIQLLKEIKLISSQVTCRLRNTPYKIELTL